jgi:hypothetical protein
MKYLEMSGMTSRARGLIMRRSAGRHQPYLSFAPVTLVSAQRCLRVTCRAADVWSK